jgi:TrmH family RNA methyltransferase
VAVNLRDRLANVVIVLDEPKDLVNIAGVVRVMMNMGLTRLRLVNPDAYDEERIDGIAHRSGRVREAVEIHSDLRAAVADAVYVVGTSARARAAPTNATRPRDIAPTLLERAAGGPVAVLFGREDRGLANEALDLCHEVVVIPTDPQRSSLNLAQASLVICYELLLAAEVSDGAEQLGRGKEARATPPATQEDVERMYDALEEGLSRIGFFKGNRTPDSVLRTLRGLLGRAAASEREAKLVQAIGYKIGYYLDRLKREDGA